MKLKNLSKEDLELLSYTEIAKLYLEESHQKLTTADLFKQVCNLLNLSEAEYIDKIADFFQSLTTSKEFILLEDGTWDLKTNHKVKIVIDDDDDDDTNQSDVSNDEVEIKEEAEDIDAINGDESFIDDDSDDELADLTIVNDDELEE